MGGTYSTFQVRQPGKRDHISRIFSTAAAVPKSLGFAEHGTNVDDCKLCGPTDVFLGFNTRPIVTSDSGLIPATIFPGSLARPFVAPTAAPNAISLEDPDEIEVDSTDEAGTAMLQASGARALSGSTAVGTKLTFENGKLAAAQSTERCWYIVTAQLTPVVTGNFRIRARRLYGEAA